MKFESSSILVWLLAISSSNCSQTVKCHNVMRITMMQCSQQHGVAIDRVVSPITKIFEGELASYRVRFLTGQVNCGIGCQPYDAAKAWANMPVNLPNIPYRQIRRN